MQCEVPFLITAAPQVCHDGKVDGRAGCAFLELMILRWVGGVGEEVRCVDCGAWRVACVGHQNRMVCHRM